MELPMTICSSCVANTREEFYYSFIYPSESPDHELLCNTKNHHGPGKSS